jgi:protein SCO1
MMPQKTAEPRQHAAAHALGSPSRLVAVLPARLQLALIALAACAAAAVLGVLAASGHQSKQPLDLDNGWAGALRPPGLDVPRFALRDQDGDLVTSRSLRGGSVVYAFVYSTCRDTCPAEVQTIRGALDDLGRDVPVIGISVDPGNDTPKRAIAFLLEQKMTGRMHFVLGSRAELQPVWRAFGIRPESERLEHSAHVVLADARGRQRIGFPFGELTEERLAHDLARLE